MNDDTIAALSTPMGRGGIAVIRISGGNTKRLISKIFEPAPSTIESHRAYHGFIHKKGKRIEECVVVFFESPNSYTGEDVAEISIHSNPFVIEEVLELIFQYKTRSALPGEFTYRGFKNDKMDLIQAESVNELINANSTYYALMKFGSLEGKLSRLIKKIRKTLIDVGVRIETKIEFEEDQFLKDIKIENELDETIKTLNNVLSSSRFNETLSRGLNVVIVGKINVGKSSLFNALLMEERAITSSVPGTTRDFIKEKIYIGGLPVELMDVAGINKKSKNEVEAKGIKRSFEKVKNSDAVIFMLDVSDQLSETDFEIHDLIKDKKKLIVANKMDIVKEEVLEKMELAFPGDKIVEISVKENTNIDKIFSFLEHFVSHMKKGKESFGINQRQKRILEALTVILNKTGKMVKDRSSPVELIAEEIRLAIQKIGELTGEITPDEILHQIFSEFCVGK